MSDGKLTHTVANATVQRERGTSGQIGQPVNVGWKLRGTGCAVLAINRRLPDKNRQKTAITIESTAVHRPSAGQCGNKNVLVIQS